MTTTRPETGPLVRLAVFAAALAVVAGAGFGIGSLVGPVGDAPAQPGPGQGPVVEHSSSVDGH